MSERTRRRLNAARARARMAGARLFVYQEAATTDKTGLAVMSVGPDVTGEVTFAQGWHVENRRMNHAGAPVPMKVHIGQGSVFTRSVASAVAAVAIVEPGATEAPVLRVAPLGIPTMPIEDEWVFDVTGPTRKTHVLTVQSTAGQPIGLLLALTRAA